MKALQWTVVATGLVASTSSAFATQYLTAQQAQALIFPQANAFKEANLQLTAEQMHAIEALSGLPARSAAWRVISAWQGDKLLGHMVLDDVIGKFEPISYAVGLAPDATVIQVEILAYRESHGFEIRNAAWRKQFVGKTAADKVTVGDNIANISGATLSSTHVTDGVRRIVAVAQVALKK
ncbi:FMN-binding protein [Noviherbaspirillum soli]|uniref:FMN-binding protein n=1 Tax=Noviherbaspirillum soli TaxID=1064518 RepID=UPI00188B9C2D|nr:FMN-binding protein [Noviherbaspirillum soli]